MDRARAEAMVGYHEACRDLNRAVSAWDAAYGVTVHQDRARSGLTLALDEERTAVEECLAEGVTLVELDALAAMAGSRFAPRWAVAAYGGGR